MSVKGSNGIGEVSDLLRASWRATLTVSNIREHARSLNQCLYLSTIVLNRLRLGEPMALLQTGCDVCYRSYGFEIISLGGPPLLKGVACLTRKINVDQMD
jgi:hypothetical protein